MGKHVAQPKTSENMCVVIPRNKWWIVTGERKPFIECPYCGNGILGDTAPHGIHANGKVFASVVCQNPDCLFHQHIQLEGWAGGEIPHC